MDQHEKFMRMAIALSHKNVEKCLGGPFGAVIVQNGKLVAKSANTVTQTCDPTAHAEVSAIRLAAKKRKTFNLQGCVIYTSCEPCPMCLGAIYWAKIDKIYYANTKSDAAAIGFDDQFIYEELDQPLDKRQLPLVRILENEAIGAFEAWTNSENKTIY